MADRFSYSRIDTYSQCGFRYKLRYEDKHYVSSDGLPTELGTAIHETEEAIANAIKAGEPINYIPLKNKLILAGIELSHKYPEAWAAEDKSNRTAKQKLYEYIKSGIYRLENFLLANGHIEVIATEKEFEYTLPGTDVIFHGFIDRILYDHRNEKYIVQDIKTYAVPVEKKNLEVPLQFVVYTHAMRDLYGVLSEDVKCAYDLPFCNLTQAAGGENFISKGTEKLIELLTNIDKKDFAPKPTPLCHWCEYCPTNPNQSPEAKNLCPYYSLWTKENKTHAVASKWEGLENHEAVLFEYIKCQNSVQ
jgi:RecB family exonuclease